MLLAGAVAEAFWDDAFWPDLLVGRQASGECLEMKERARLGSYVLLIAGYETERHELEGK